MADPVEQLTAALTEAAGAPGHARAAGGRELTATTPPTWRCSSPARRAAHRARSRRSSSAPPPPSTASRRPRSPGPASSTSSSPTRGSPQALASVLAAGDRVRRWLRRGAGARPGGDGVREPDRPDDGRGGPQRRLRRLRRPAARLRRSHGRARVLLQRRRRARWTASARRSTPCAAARSRPRTATTATTSPSSRRSTATRCRVMLGLIEAALERFRISFDTFERQSVVEAEVPEAIALLDTYEEDGALWARTSAHGDEKDRVLRRSDGTPTYFAADAAYVRRKYAKGFDHLVLRPRCRPPRLRRPPAGAGRDARPSARVARGADLPARPPDEGRRGDEDVQAPRRRRVPGRLHRRDRHRRGPLVPRLARPRPDDRHRHRPGGREVREEPGLLRPVRARPHRRDPPQRAGAAGSDDERPHDGRRARRPRSASS